MDLQQIIAGTVGKENTFGTCMGLIKPEPMIFARFSTDDNAGKMRGYAGEAASPTIRSTLLAEPGSSAFPKCAVAALHL